MAGSAGNLDYEIGKIAGTIRILPHMIGVLFVVLFGVLGWIVWDIDGNEQKIDNIKTKQIDLQDKQIDLQEEIHDIQIKLFYIQNSADDRCSGQICPRNY